MPLRRSGNHVASFLSLFTHLGLITKGPFKTLCTRMPGTDTLKILSGPRARVLLRNSRAASLLVRDSEPDNKNTTAPPGPGSLQASFVTWALRCYINLRNQRQSGLQPKISEYAKLIEI